MEENKDFDVVATIKELVESYKHLADEISEIRASIMDNLLNPIKEEFEQMKYDNALSDFRCKYAEKLEPFNDKLKVLEKDENFDVVKKAFDDFSERTDGMEEADYVDALADKIQEQLDEIASLFGVEPEKIEEVKVETEEGEVKAEVKDGEVTEVEKEAEVETETSETSETPAETTEATEEKAPEAPEAPETEIKVEEEEEPEKETTASKLDKLLHN